MIGELVRHRETLMKEEITENAMMDARLAEASEDPEGPDFFDALQTIDQMEFDMTKIQSDVHRLYFHNLNNEENPFSMPVTRKETFDYLYMHPLWYRFIDKMLKADNRFFDKVFQSIESLVDPSSSKMLMKILNIEKKASEVPPSNRFLDQRESSL